MTHEMLNALLDFVKICASAAAQQAIHRDGRCIEDYTSVKDQEAYVRLVHSTTEVKP